MGILDDLLGNEQLQKQYRDFVKRYEQGDPSEGYSDQEVLKPSWRVLLDALHGRLSCGSISQRLQTLQRGQWSNEEEGIGFVGLQGIVSIVEKDPFRKLGIPGTFSEASKRLLRRPVVPAANRSRPYAAALRQAGLQ